jgi:hypothetical protein
MKMKLLGALTIGAALTVLQARAQGQNFLQNGDFSAPGTGKISSGFDSVPGWFTGGAAADTGVDPLMNLEKNATIPDPSGGTSLYEGYVYNIDSEVGLYANQTTIYTLGGDNAGDNLYVSLYARNNNTVDQPNWWPQDPGLLTVSLYAWDGAAKHYFFAQTLDLGLNNENFNLYTIYIDNSQLATALALFSGDQVGISISDTSLDSSGGTADWSWLNFTDVVLNNTEAVPEPATLALLTLGGLSALVAIRRRR